MAVKFKTVITKAGAEKLAAATVPNGKKVNFTTMAVGDGGGTLPTPDPNQTKLVKEVWRHALNKISQDKKNKNYVVAELLIPPETGGFWMREMGLYDDAGTLIAVGNMAESYKPALAEGSGRAQTVRMVIMVSDIASVELTIDTSMVMATQDYVDDKLAEHEQSRRHPDATLTAKGFTQLSSATDSASEALAATPKAVKAAYDLAKGKYTAQDATTAQKGIVQLSSATDSASEAFAATPKAVSAAAKAIKDTLGTSASKDVVTSKTDTTTGRVLTTGWMSLGGYGTDNLIAAADALKPLRNGFYAVQSEPTYGNSALISFGYDSGSQVHIIAKQGGQNPLLGVCGSTPQGAFGNWGKIYTEFQKPTALDVGAVPYRGALGTEDLNTVTGTKYGRFSQPLTANATAARHYPITEAGALDVHQTNANGAEACVQEYRSFNSRRIFLRTYNPDGAVWNDWCEFYTTSKKPTASDVGAIPLAGSTGVTGIVRSSAELQSLSANSFRIGYGGYGTFWRNDGANLYLMLTNQNDSWGGYNDLRPFRVSLGTGDVTISKLGLIDYTNFDGRYYTKAQSDAGYMAKTGAYTKAESDARFQPKGSYTPSGTAYTKAESDARYYTKAQSDAGYNAKNTASLSAAGGWQQDNSTGLIIQMGTVTRTGYNTAVNFPKAFPNFCMGVLLTLSDAGTGNLSDSSSNIRSLSHSKTGFNYGANGNPEKTAFWVAFGK
ncbi:phage tail protein [Enterobacter ludwigii]